jgi:hypothetical protein
VPNYAVLLGAVALSLTAFAMSLGLSAQPTLAAGPADSQANELVRLINGERAYLGKPALKNDTFLASKARDGAVVCPNDSSKVMSGRSHDWAVYGWPANAHALRLCPSYTSMDAMREWGYNTYRGEITALNGGYGTGAVAYHYGCSPSVRSCPGGSTTASHTAAVAMSNWTSSPGHYAVMVGNYDRIGCGAWIGSNGAYFYDCMASKGGRGTPHPAKAPVSHSGTGTGIKTGTSTGAAGFAPAPTATWWAPAGQAGITAINSIAPVAPAADPTAVVKGVTSLPSPAPLSAQVATAKGGPQSGPPLGAAPATSRNLSLAAGAITAALSLSYGLFLSLRQRRRRGLPAR